MSFLIRNTHDWCLYVEEWHKDDVALVSARNAHKFRSREKAEAIAQKLNDAFGKGRYQVVDKDEVI